MNRKQELVELIMGIVTPGNADRKTLELHNIPELEAIYESAHQEEQLLQAQASAAAQRVMAELAKQQLDEIRRPQFEREQKQQLEQDRKTFEAAARKLRFSLSDANFSIIRNLLGPNFSVRDIENNYLRLGVGIELIPATTKELNMWASEQIQERNSYLRNASPEALRTEAKQEATQNRQSHAQTAFEAELIAGLTREAGLPNLPEYWGTKRLDPEFIRRADKETLRQIIKRHGSARLTARLHNITRIGNFTL